LSKAAWASTSPLLAKEGWLRHKEMAPFLNGADGVVVSRHRLFNLVLDE
jgi:hypothetical protein